MKTLLTLLLLSSALIANPRIDFSQDQKIGVQNTILAKVNGKIISMIDVKKKMDMSFHQNYPHLIESNQARVQFYETSWRHVLMDMIDQELIIADALDKEIKLTDGEIREVLEDRFGPNVTQTLDKVGLSHDEAWKMIKDELIVQRMSWWFIQSKAVGSVTPQDIRNAYRLHLKNNPAYSEWTYRVVSIRSDEANVSIANEVHAKLIASGKTPELLEAELKLLEKEGLAISVSSEFHAKTDELSDLHKSSLINLEPGAYGTPSFQVARDKKNVARIFYLAKKNEIPAPKFEDMSAHLRNQLIQGAITKTSDAYLNKLRKHYGFEAENTIPDDLHPFSLQ